MSHLPASSRSLQVRGLRKVTLLVPESCVGGFRQFAGELRARQQAGSTEATPRWVAISPSAELMVSPERSVRCAVRDTRAPGGDRFRWTVTVLGQLDPVAEGCTEDRAEARSLAEAAVAACFADGHEHPAGGELSGTVISSSDRRPPKQSPATGRRPGSLEPTNMQEA